MQSHHTLLKTLTGCVFLTTLMACSAIDTSSKASLAGALPLTAQHDASSRSDCEVVEWQQHHYVMCKQQAVPFPVARQACEAMNMKLVRIDTAEENQWLYQTFYQPGAKGMMWTGATDNAVEGEWRWLIGGDVFWRGTGQQGSAQNGLYTNWGHAHKPLLPGEKPEQPNDAHSAEGEDCQVIRGPGEHEEGHWTDVGCGAENNPPVAVARVAAYTCESY